MKISLFIKNIVGRSGGAEKVVCDLANILKKKGYDVEVVHYDGSDRPCNFILNSKIDYIDIKYGFFYNIFSLWWWVKQFLKELMVGNKLGCRWYKKNAKYLMSIRSFYKGKKGKVVVIAFLPPAFTYVSEALYGLNEIRVIASNHNVPEKDYLDAGRWDPDPYDQMKRLSNLERCSAVTVLLPRFLEFFQKRGIENVHVISNMVLEPSKNLHLPSVFQNSKKYLLSVGRFVPHKNMDKLILAFSKLMYSFPEWSLILVGSGPSWSECVALANSVELGDRIYFSGAIQNVDDYYAIADIFVMPSSFEGFGLVTVEAFNHGLPVIGFAECPGTSDIVVNRKNGILVSIVDPVSSLERAMCELMENEELRESLGRNAKLSACEYRPETIIKEWETIICI